MSEKPSRVTKLPDHEVAICSRVRAIRIRNRHKQADVATILGLSTSRYKNIEYGVTPLKFREAVYLCSEYDINPLWLATGDGPQQPYIDLEPIGELVTKLTKPFSEVCEKYLLKSLESSLSNMGKVIGEDPDLFDEWTIAPKLNKGIPPQTSNEAYEKSERFLVDKIRYYYGLLWNEDQKEDYIQKITDLAEEYYGQSVDKLHKNAMKDIQKRSGRQGD